MSADGSTINCTPLPEASAGSLRHLFLDQVFPLALSLSGRCVIHAAGVRLRSGHAIAFAATSGSGKSTLTASLVNAGCQLLTDDGLLLDDREGDLTVVPSYPGVRLWSDSANAIFGQNIETEEYAHYSRKKRISLESNSVSGDDRAAPLKALYFLGPTTTDSDIRFTPMSPRQAFLELVKYTFTLNVKDQGHLRRNFERFSQMSAFPIHYRLDYPRRWDRLPAVVEAVLDHVADS